MTNGLRSLLFVPGDDQRKINRAVASKADAVIIDLEDSVALHNKEAARRLAAEILQQARKITIFVRINDLSSGQSEADLDAVLSHRPDGIVLPKCRSGDDIIRLAVQTGPNIPAIAIATETASSLLAMATYASAGTTLAALAWGGEDLSVDLGAATNRASDGRYADPYRLARTLCLVGARAAQVEPIDAVFTAYRDLAGLEIEAETAARDGFSGKLAIHPDQVPIINRAFTPSEKEVERAKRVVAAFESANRRGVIGLDGEMLDVPHLRRAERILARAGRSGGDNGQ
jgi:citrate lyase subunit beta/citryl-CoA lyase